MMASLVKKPARSGMPVSAKLPKVKQAVVRGAILYIPPIFRMSCSSIRQWIIDPEQRNSIALKKACVQI